MTDLPRLSNSHQVPLFESVVGTNADTLQPLPKLLNGASVEEDEEYTIKCICDFQDDDGNTIFCETCETWQHIECYYEPGNVPGKDDNHNCSDCEPRALDARLATERQRAKRMDIDIGDKKIKKPPAKSHKRKIKLDAYPTVGVLADKNDIAYPRNGIGTHAREQPTTKRQKSSHKPSNSITAHNAHIKQPAQSRRSASASHTLPSPSKTSTHPTLEFTYEPYSAEFMNLYDNDPGETSMDANVHIALAMASSLAEWSNDVDALAEATNGRGHQDVFLRSDQSTDEMTRPSIHKQCKEDPEKLYHGRCAKWVYLTVDSDLLCGSFVGELRGHIGYMKDYVQNEENRWEYLRHPLPFVFFHPALPIYIDTRHSGTLLRYLRRSCQPNLTMRTILEGHGEYHFCFMANQDIGAGSELTIPWTTDEHVRAFTQKLGGGIKSEGSTEIDEGYVLDYFSKVFADFGGCACGMPDQCSVSNLARRLRLLASEQPTSNGKSKKGGKSGNHALANSGTRGNASRSGSEAIKYQDGDEMDDGHSTSTSSRSKPQSRDITPANQSNSETKGRVPGLEASERDKRKIAAMERAEQDKNQPAQKKKKRVSGQLTNVNSTTAVGVTDFSPHLRSKVDEGLQKQSSNSIKSRSREPSTVSKQLGSPVTIPMTATKTSSTSNPANAQFSKPTYVDASMQTDPDPEDRFSAAQATFELPHKPFMSLKKRLLTKAHQEKVTMETERKSEKTLSVKMPDSPAAHSNPSPTASVSSTQDSDGDTIMHNGVTTASPGLPMDPPVEKPRPPSPPAKSIEDASEGPAPPVQFLPPPLAKDLTWPSMASPQGFRNTALRVTLPPNPLTNGVSSTPSALGQCPIVQTPSTTLAHSLSVGTVQPSPIKKKLSLGDYISRRGSSFQKPETPTAATPGVAKEKDREANTSSPTAPTFTEASRTLLSVSEESAQEKVSEDGMDIAGVVEVGTETEATTTAPPDAMKMDYVPLKAN
ncbi:MAG: hypothetical protein LQ340_003290 [Diploschistes diacapsis]|nr:MAG: hypothetical protein LQ340_003290 [Diploschistes diacapsis]